MKDAALAPVVLPSPELEGLAIIKVLDVGCGVKNNQINSPESLINFVYGDDVKCQVSRMDIDDGVSPDIIHDINRPLPSKLRGAFDVVFASHVINMCDYSDVVSIIENISTALKDNGELWIAVPALEYLAREITMLREQWWTMMFLYGEQRKYNYIHSAFTLSTLRKVMEALGFVVVRAWQSEYGIGRLMPEKDEAAVRQNFVIANKMPRY